MKNNNVTISLQDTANQLCNILNVAESEKQEMLKLDTKELETVNNMLFQKFVEKYDLTL